MSGRFPSAPAGTAPAGSALAGCALAGSALAGPGKFWQVLIWYVLLDGRTKISTFDRPSGKRHQATSRETDE